jgi:hypothetical protein
MDAAYTLTQLDVTNLFSFMSSLQVLGIFVFAALLLCAGLIFALILTIRWSF